METQEKALPKVEEIDDLDQIKEAIFKSMNEHRYVTGKYLILAKPKFLRRIARILWR
jgi:hypothetical protein